MTSKSVIGAVSFLAHGPSVVAAQGGRMSPNALPPDQLPSDLNAAHAGQEERAQQSVPDSPAATEPAPASESRERERDEEVADTEQDTPVPSDPSPASAPAKDGPEKVKILPKRFEHCSTAILGQLVGLMLGELVQLNDGLPLREGQLTRFHSREPPAISASDYLRRIVTHAALPPAVLLTLIYYIDELCARWPVFSISSLTVHRVLITASTVAAKGLSDSFWTNGTYARVGGISPKELAMLELDLLKRLDWRIIPPHDRLEAYYHVLVGRTTGFEISDEDGESPAGVDPLALHTESIPNPAMIETDSGTDSDAASEPDTDSSSDSDPDSPDDDSDSADLDSD